MERELRSVSGIRLGTAAAGIKYADREDLVVVEMAEGSSCAAVFTRNAFRAAPVALAHAHLAGGHAPRWLLINSGNANAGTGTPGWMDALATCAALADLTGGRVEQVLPFSTGVIGEYLPLEKIRAALPVALAALSQEGWGNAARAIMTTDTRPKMASQVVDIADHPVTITGIAKGAGMIHPNMATLLVFIGTDARVDLLSLQGFLQRAVDRSFNRITVDGDTSTNDSCVLMASNRSKSGPIVPGTAAARIFEDALDAVCQGLAEAIIRDAEGATKFIEILVEAAGSEEEAVSVAKTIAHSPLVKTAFFASDPNWGRILAAVGRAECPNLDVSRVSIWLDEVKVVSGGERDPGYTEAQGLAVMSRRDITVRVALGRGAATARVLTCDLSYDYVRINAEYRS